jgi:hypothetical protein
MRFDGVSDMVARMRADVVVGRDAVTSDDEPQNLTIGFAVSDGNDYVRHWVNLTSVKRGERDPVLRELIATRDGRRRIALCITHGHGFLKVEHRSCLDCLAHEVMES